MDIGVFKKVYKVEPTQKQRESITRAFKSNTLYRLSQGENITCRVERFEGCIKSIIVELISDKHGVVQSRLIGPNGGITSLGLG